MVGRGTYSGSKEETLSRITEAELAAMYIPSLKAIPEVINSPLRKDEHPSFRVYSPDGVKVRYYDYATGESGGIIDFVMNLYSCSYNEALERIDRDIAGYGKSIPVRCEKGNALSIKRDTTDFQIRSSRREWEEWDIEYWKSYGVPFNWLKHADIYPISYIFIISENGYIKTVKADKYAYTFIERKDGKVSEKVYQPFNKDGMKWRSGHDSSVWDLWTKLPERGDILIITSSRKDALCIWANTGIPSVSLQSENALIKPQVMDELKGRFNRIYLLYDNDFDKEKNHGREDGIKLASIFNIKQIEIPDVYRAKDPSDLYKKWGGKTLRQVIKFLTSY